MMLDNKWEHGKVRLELPALPAALISLPGIKPVAAVLDDTVGREIVLLITEPEDKTREFEGIKITEFRLSAGLAKTSYGPVCFMLFCFPNPGTGARVVYENTINPKNQRQLHLYKVLSNQTYWHVIIATDTGDVVNFFEFPNDYGLRETLERVESVCEKLEVSDFDAAKAEYERTYTIDQLLAQ
ncbi:MAG: hypothetical protein OXU75_15330 [Deltaproteobacteria bacterium]|nr:hypothetical protein [Deltaproteobacteria bacterium]